MNKFKLFMPVEVHFGTGEFNKVGEYAHDLGKRAFVVTGEILSKMGLGNRLVEILKKVNIETVIYDKVKANPDCFSIDEASKILKDEKCDFVIGLGGGSPMDFAKAVAVAAMHDGPIWSYVNYSGAKFIPPTEKTLPILEIVTTAGTGSEVTPYAVMVNPENHIKAAINSPYTYPEISVIDPELMISMPPDLTASTGMDAFAHAFESYINIVRRTLFSDMMALEAIRLVAGNLATAVKDGSNIEARSNMAWASTLAGITISQANTTAVHAMAQPVSGRTDAPHGSAVAALLPAVMRHTWQADIKRFSNIAEAMGIKADGLLIEKKAEMGVEKIEKLLKDIGLGIGLKDIGVSKDTLEKLTEDTMAYMSRPISQHPRQFSPEEILEIFNESF